MMDALVEGRPHEYAASRAGRSPVSTGPDRARAAERTTDMYYQARARAQACRREPYWTRTAGGTLPRAGGCGSGARLCRSAWAVRSDEHLLGASSATMSRKL